jgi:hypothetical protein
MTEIKIELRKEEITQRLYSIQNIAYLVSDCPEDKASIIQIEGVLSGIGRLIQNLIDDIGD